MPLLSATGPVQERNRDVNDPAAGAHAPLTVRSRVVHVSIPRVGAALVQRANPTRVHAEIFRRTVFSSDGNADAPMWDCPGAKARVKASLRSVGAARP